MPTEPTEIVQLLSQMRHDLRSALIGISDLAQLLKKALQSSPHFAASEILCSAISACLDFQTACLDDMIEQSMQEKPFCLRKMIESAIDLVRPRLALKNLILDFYFDDQLPYHVHGNALRLFRIVHELLTNAVKFTDAGKITVRFTYQSLQDQQFLLSGSIADTGIGIASHEKKAIFQRFYRGHLEYPGCGMGLFQVKKDIDAMQGSIQVQSQLGQDTCFQFAIPLRMDSLIPLDHSQQKLTGMRALLIEDHPVTAMATKALINELGCDVDVAHDGQHAMTFIQQVQYDFILMDLHLPDIDSGDLQYWLRITAKTVPMIGLTADRKQCEKNGLLNQFSVILEKPLSVEMLLNALRCQYA